MASQQLASEGPPPVRATSSTARAPALASADALEAAILCCDLFQVQALLRDGADPNASSPSTGEPLLRLAARAASVELGLLALLLGFSADPSALAAAPPAPMAASAAVAALGEVFSRRAADGDEHRAALASLDPGALAQARKFLKLPGPFALGGVPPRRCMLEPERVVEGETTSTHRFSVHFADTLRPVLDLRPLCGEASSLVVLLHGLFQSGPQLRRLARELAGALPGCRLLLPTAPTRVSWGVGPAWFNYLASDAEKIQELEQAKAEVLELLSWQSQEAGIGPDRVVLAGFSMGGAAAAWTALRLPCRLAGLLLLGTEVTGSVVGETEDGRQASDEFPPIGAGAEGLAVLQLHGAADALVPVAAAAAGAARLRRLGCEATFEEHVGVGHSLSEPMVASARSWLAERLAGGGGGSIRR